MQHIFYPSQKRGHTYLGWLDSRHSFSFGNFYDPELMSFGKLRVLNDDIILGGSGFGMHPHRDMEIITIPLKGGLSHEDSTRAKGVIGFGDVQIMSAGTGIWHSEYNASQTENGNFLQLWIEPSQYSITPRYAEIKYNTEDLQDNVLTLVSPDDSDKNLKIYQNAYLSLARCSSDNSLKYHLKSIGNGLYIFVISGSVNINGQNLNTKDALGLIEIQEPVEIYARQESFLLIVEVPME